MTMAANVAAVTTSAEYFFIGVGSLVQGAFTIDLALRWCILPVCLPQNFPIDICNRGANFCKEYYAIPYRFFSNGMEWSGAIDN